MLKVIVSNLTADDILIIGFEAVSYVEVKRRLGEQSPEMWSTVSYMKLCVDRDLNCGRQLVT